MRWNASFLSPREHASHCVDWIWHFIVCHSDTSVLVYVHCDLERRESRWQWNSRYNQSPPQTRVPRTCRNFQPIQRCQWGMQNAMLVEYNDMTLKEDDLPIPLKADRMVACVLT
ncbi:hypothetical protein B0H16DRAFT_387731 [Mycena metata]|uniref:Uncharacterized protein n=1 Tax=Mycena metata TaxID=1033252 RepID=A0AAD7NKZ7_9AGAR|nr:hypothetical protein B0H16DRAFT_387731 [Mycena metata]